MTGPSTMAHHRELHERVKELEAAFARVTENRDGWFRSAERYLARAEKAEADLAAEREHVAAHCPWPEQPCIYWKQRAAGRESGMTAEGRKGRLAGAEPAAAKPAARRSAENQECGTIHNIKGAAR